MRTLIVETATTPGAFALMDDARVLWEQHLAPGERSAESLLPHIQGVLGTQGWEPWDIELVVVAHGPGSFTGLRVGLTMAKLFGYLTGCPIVAVDTMSAIAAGLPAVPKRIWIVLDAQRKGLYVSEFKTAAQGDGPDLQDHLHVVAVEELLARLTAGDAICGTGATRVQLRLPADVHVLDPNYWKPQPVAMGRLGQHRARTGRFADPFTLRPLYLSESAAIDRQANESQS